MMFLRQAARQAAVVALLGWGLISPAAGAEEAAVDGSVTLGAPLLPAPRQGGRLLAHAFGAPPGDAIREVIGAEWTDLKAFREIVDDGGQHRLDLRIRRAAEHFRDVGDAGQPRGTLRVELDASCSWMRDGRVVHDIELRLEAQKSLDERPTRRDLEGLLTDMFRQVAQRAFSGYYESGRHETGEEPPVAAPR